VEGYHLACKESIKYLQTLSTKIDVSDKETLLDIAKTSMASKGAHSQEILLSEMLVDAITKIVDENKKVDIDNIKILKITGNDISNSKIIDGMILDKERAIESMPNEIDGAKILLLNEELDFKKTNVESKINITDPTQLNSFLDSQEQTFKDMANKIISLGANVVFNQQHIDDAVSYYLAKAGVYAIQRVKKDDLKKLSKATGGKIVMNLDDIPEQSFGYADTVKQEKINDVKSTFIIGCNNMKAITLLLRGTTKQVVDELERALHDALSVLKLVIENSDIIPGGGACNIELAQHLREYSTSIGGRQQMAIEEFASALEIIPQVLSQNAGMNPIDTLLQLRKYHKDGEKEYGVDVNAKGLNNLLSLRVVEPCKLLEFEIESATEATSMILRIDDIIASKKSEMPQQPPSGGMPQNPYM